MDDLENSMGKLSTRAKEWKPSSITGATGATGGGLGTSMAAAATTTVGGRQGYNYSSAAASTASFQTSTIANSQSPAGYTSIRGQNTSIADSANRSLLHAPIYAAEYNRPSRSNDASLSMTATSEWTSSSWAYNESTTSNKKAVSYRDQSQSTVVVETGFKNNHKNTFNIHAPKWNPTKRNQEKEAWSSSFASEQTKQSSSSQSMSATAAKAAAASSSLQPTWQLASTFAEENISQPQYEMTTDTTISIIEPAAPTESNPATLPRGNMPNPPWGSVRSNNTLTQPHYKNIHSYGLPNHTLWSLYRSIAMDCTREMDPHDARYKAIPPNFTNAMPLEHVHVHGSISLNHNGGKAGAAATTTGSLGNYHNNNNTTTTTRSSFGYHSSIFRVTNQEDGKLYCLRRFDHVRGVNQKIASTVTSAWTRAAMQHRASSFSASSRSSSGTTTSASLSFQNRMMMTAGRGGIGIGGGGGGGGRGDSQRRRLLEHPGLVRFYKCFYVVSNRAVFFLHEYHPMSLTLRECVYGVERGGMTGGWTDEQALGPGAFRPLEEEVIWSYVTQLISAVRAVHRANMACRTLQLQHILVCPDAGSGMDETAAQMMMMSTTSMGSEGGLGLALRTNRVRLRINCLGIVDALEFEARKTVQELQMEDMKSLGRILLSLASGTEVRGNASEELYNQCQDYMQQNYSEELYKLTVSLLARPRPGRMGMMIVDPPSIDEVCHLIAEHALDEMDSTHVIMDGMDQALAAEYESGRMLRLMMKLAFINERPEFGVDPRWSESGDCYVLKLFRDYVFHQADESGRPIMDLGHVISALNKLDAAEEDEQIVLTSRDGKTIMVVSYADIARYSENAYAELCNSSVSMQQASSENMMGGL